MIHESSGAVLAGAAALGATRSGDLLSYLLFDGGFASELIALGRSDAQRMHDELCAFFAESVRDRQ
jgi:NTE family protein